MIKRNSDIFRLKSQRHLLLPHSVCFFVVVVVVAAILHINTITPVLATRTDDDDGDGDDSSRRYVRANIRRL